MRRLLTQPYRPYLMPWQDWWLLDVVRQMPDVGGRGTWLRRTSESSESPYVRAYALLVRATHGQVTEGEIARDFSRGA